jgi:starvation-inducible DNA-binding protein
MYENKIMSPSEGDLAAKLSELLGSTVALKYLAQGFHWNVRGPYFAQFHKFYGKIYEALDEMVDPLGENVRKLGYDAPFTLEDFISLSCVDTREVGNDPLAMSGLLHSNLCTLKDKTDSAFSLANSLNRQGVVDFLAGLIGELEKWIWQLGATVSAEATQVKIVEIRG